MTYIVQALYCLLRTDWLMWRGGLPAVHNRLKQISSSAGGSSRFEAERMCRAVDIACVLYFKRALCLQRSAATAMLLRHHRHPAELVIGAQILPFKAHAWVELHGQVINDVPYISQLYRELERC